MAKAISTRDGSQGCYTLDEACRFTGLGRTKLYEEINAGHIKAVKAGRRTLIPIASIIAWIESLPARRRRAA
jgi:excisionase family DNA binding protein